MKLKLVTLATAATLFSGASIAAEDKLTIGMSQYPSTLHPIIDSMVLRDPLIISPKHNHV